MREIREMHERALELGFSEAWCMQMEDIPAWREEAEKRIGREWQPGLREMEHFPAKKYPGSSVLLLLMPYKAYALPPHGCMRVHPYYSASNLAYKAAQKLAEQLGAIYDPKLPIKPLAHACGIGEYGWNQLILHPEHGTRIALQALVLLGNIEHRPEKSGKCFGCGACRRACPTGALTEAGFQPKKCLRSHMLCAEGPPEELFPHMQDLLLGCHHCQDACPLNSKETCEPDFQPEIFSTERILRQEPGLKAAWEPHIGANYARPGRAVAQALLHAGALGEEAFLPLIKKHSGMPAARWAEEQILCKSEEKEYNE